ncbi:MAG: zinc transport system permease protein [Cryptosporangiaceae bacterium]|nr:zinc transport system permease protein [Cryptosporangiaceae bacterium]
MTLLSYHFMQRAFVAALLVSLAAPAVGIYLVQRRMALIGDGIGHVALTGVAVGILFKTQPVYTAVVVSAAAALVIELVRSRGRTSGDVALALMFYGGIALGALLIDKSQDASPATLVSNLFGSLLTTSNGDLVAIAVLGGIVLTIAVVLRPWFFAASHDEEYAVVSGLPVRALNMLLAVMAAVTVTAAMRVVGLLLVSALMVVPVATAQQLGRSFASTLVAAIVVAETASLAGTAGSYYLDTKPGPTIVVLALALFAAVTVYATAIRRWRGSRSAAAQAAADPAKNLIYES